MSTVSTPPANLSLDELLRGGGEMGERIRRHDWSRHPLGEPSRWPQSLRIAIRLMLTSRYAMWLGWGPELFFFCNDAYLPTLGVKREWFLGEPARKVWEEIWSDIKPRVESVLEDGRATWDESLLLFLGRSGFSEETYHTFSYSPMPDDQGGIGGLLCVVTEDTDRVLSERRLAFLRDLAAALGACKGEAELFRLIAAQVRAQAKDTPFLLAYLFDADGKGARLVLAEMDRSARPAESRHER